MLFFVPDEKVLNEQLLTISTSIINPKNQIKDPFAQNKIDQSTNYLHF